MDAITICNIALSHIGKPHINSLGEASAQGQACNVHYDHTRRLMLQSSAWSFAKRRVQGAETTNDFPERWRCAYLRPAGALHIQRVYATHSPHHAGPRPDFEVRENKVYTNVPEAQIEIILDLQDATTFSPLFAEALAFALAVPLARQLTRSSGLAREMKEEARQALSRAITADSSQDADTYLFDGNARTDDYTEARR